MWSVGLIAAPADGDWLLPASIAVGVGQEPEAFAAVGGTNGGRTETTPFRIEPEVGKVGEDVWEAEPNKSGDVLQVDVPRSHVSDDPGNVAPEPSLVIDTTLPTGGAERLAVEAGSDEIHASSPRATVEGGDVIPDRRAIQGRLVHPGHERGRRVGVPLNTSHGSYVESCESEAELESSVAVEETQGM